MSDLSSSMLSLKTEKSRQLKIELKVALRWLSCASFFVIFALFLWLLSTFAVVSMDLLRGTAVLGVLLLLFALVKLDIYRIQRTAVKHFFK